MKDLQGRFLTCIYFKLTLCIIYIYNKIIFKLIWNIERIIDLFNLDNKLFTLALKKNCVLTKLGGPFLLIGPILHNYSGIIILIPIIYCLGWLPNRCGHNHKQGIFVLSRTLVERKSSIYQHDSIHYKWSLPGTLGYRSSTLPTELILP